MQALGSPPMHWYGSTPSRLVWEIDVVWERAVDFSDSHILTSHKRDISSVCFQVWNRARGWMYVVCCDHLREDCTEMLLLWAHSCRMCRCLCSFKVLSIHVLLLLLILDGWLVLSEYRRQRQGSTARKNHRKQCQIQSFIEQLTSFLLDLPYSDMKPFMRGYRPFLRETLATWAIETSSKFIQHVWVQSRIPTTFIPRQ